MSGGQDRKNESARDVFPVLISKEHTVQDEGMFSLWWEAAMAHWRLLGNQFVCLLSWCFVAVTVHCSLPPLQHALLNGIYKTCGLFRLSSSSLSRFCIPLSFSIPLSLPSPSLPLFLSVTGSFSLFVSHSSHQSSIMWRHRSFQDAHSHSLHSQSRPALC